MNNNQEKTEQQSELIDLKITYKTRGDTTIQGKQRVFVSYDLRDKYLLEAVCDDFLSIVDCAILFSDEANIKFERVEEKAERIDLLVLCITSNYLHGTDVSPEEEIQYAQVRRIPILPLLLEEDADDEYQRRFPQIQYLKKNNKDITEIPYTKKLSDYLSSVLINDELFAKIRDAFDAYIFLSYRKKDRKYAQELMHLIHSNPFCREVAIWYDEYLVPGENFSDAIKKMIEDSHLFAMVVTPNILEDGNYIMREEYPFASATKKNILPVSMAATDKEQLQTLFPGISDPVDGRKDELSESLKKAISEFANKPRAGEPMHTFFIGLAYLLGIEVEEDNKMGLSMITQAAEEGLPEAAKKLGQLYRYGQGVEMDISIAIDWQKKYRNLLKAEYKDVLDDKINVLIEAEYDLAEMELETGRIKDARNTCWRGIKLCRSNGGYSSFYSASRIPYYAKLYMLLGDVFFKRDDENQAEECYDRSLKLYLSLSEKNPDILDILMNTCRCFFKLYDNLHLRFGEWYYDTVISYVKYMLNIHYDVDILLMLAKCYQIFGHCKGSNGKSDYENSATVCNEILKQHKSACVFSVLADVYISLSECSLYYEEGKESEYYVQKAESVCRESLNLSKSSTGYNDLIRCYCHMVKILRQNDSKKGLKCLSSESLLKLFKIYDKVQNILAVLNEKYPGPKTDLLDFKMCAVFYELCTKETAMEAYDKVLPIVRQNPILYYSDYSGTKRMLWQHGKLDERVYQNYIPFYISVMKDQNRYFEALNQSREILFMINIVGEHPSKPVLPMIKISEDVLLGMRCDEYHEIGDRYTHYHSLQICKVDSELTIYSRPNPTPDEYVYLFLKNGWEVEEVKYIRCYG